MNGITARQRQVLDVIHAHIDAHGFPPTVREIGAALGIRTTNGVADHLRALARKGFIRVDYATSRGIFVNGRSRIASVVGSRVFTSRIGARFVFVEPQRDRQSGETYFPSTPIVARPA